MFYAPKKLLISESKFGDTYIDNIVNPSPIGHLDSI